MTYVAKNLTTSGRELIAFRAGGQEFCVNVMSVREIRGWTPATAMPHAPSYMLGVINLRGAVLPIIDFSARLGMKPAEPTVRHVIIVAQVKSQVVGLLVDAVSDILTVSDGDIQPTPDIASDFERSFARGVLAIEGRMICLVELDQVCPQEEREAA
ncbi:MULTISPECIES: chemotaxis protein CheW [Sinorhizobium]|uniref:Chemotaxis protein CheW n=2 Tax=Sinorhizobium TaxID=28105 RepID=A0A2S3YUA2_9HYPH|nr:MULTISPECIES: chemotaxis protein CheW [Sinorhizobium]ASY55258.1 Positive regulator of CheA protein activity (CheW) [Sinorhizobium sp. CCBAU 05631]AUX75231.1 chemotaxis signal transduction protein CheW 1 [Sinorhizobium fredii]PDT38908.1 chemotaxis protein CheW [Sinorhizobium sp. FG01]POH35175.1 chemotaxis protein CheW [Sinorhizobium americanum]